MHEKDERMSRKSMSLYSHKERHFLWSTRYKRDAVIKRA